MALRALAFAKLNLGLHVLRRRPDGFHDIRTVFVPLRWHDIITVEAHAEIRLQCSDSRLPIDQNNLCVKAAALLASHAGVSAGAKIHLEKRVPFGAGLGGGSSDAAVTLKLLNDLWNLCLSAEELRSLGARLGSDVPFFVDGRPALGEGRGEVLTPLPEGFRMPGRVVVVVPDVHVSTAEAYRAVTPRERNVDLAELVRSADPERWRAELVNDFEEPIFALYPAIRAVKSRLVEMGADYAAMSGSGSAVFGVFRDAERAATAAAHFGRPGYNVWEE